MTPKEILAITRCLNVLYVEDEEQIRSSTVELFDNFFGHIETAADGVDGIEKFNASHFDLLITDISMPRMDGIELIRHIRKSHPKLPIIVYSAWNDPAYMTACITLNVDGYLQKPMQSSSVMEVLGKIALRLQHANQKKCQPIEETSYAFKAHFNRDALTQLLSHNALMEELESIGERQTPVLILIDINAFHIYNEIYGLRTGDAIMKQFADSLRSYCEPLSYRLYRMSGDAFVLFDVSEYLDPDYYDEEVQKLLAYIDATPIRVEEIDEPVQLSVTIGVSFERENCYGRADMALHEARRRGRSYLGFSAETDRKMELQKNLYWRKEIGDAISENRVHAYYHSIVDKNEQVIKYEALIRIEQPQPDGSLKVVSPAEFLDFSKVSGQYIQLTTVMIKEAFKTMIEKNVHVAINLTHHDIENREINKLLQDNIIRHNLANKMKFDISSQVIFELLDQPHHEGYERFVAFINEFKNLGVLITVDNFGLGFSNMAKVAALSPHYVKIDSTLMKNIDTDQHAYQLVRAIVKFTQELGIKTIAEHVTSKSIFETSKELGIDEFQGYYFSQPVKDIPDEEM